MMIEILEEIKAKLNGETSAVIGGVDYSLSEEGSMKVYRVLFTTDEIRARAVRLEEDENAGLELHYSGFLSEETVLEALRENKEPESDPEQTNE